MNTPCEAAVLIVEDNDDIAAVVGAYLEKQGYSIDYAADGITGLHLAVTNDYDVILLDIMLPGLDGIEVCRKLRQQARKNTPVLMLTARDTTADIVTGLDCGADDYMVKPFDVRELEARVRAQSRRHKGLLAPEFLQVGDLTLDLGTLKVKRAGKLLSLTPIGLKILTVLMRASPNVVSRGELERVIWQDEPPDSDALRSHLYTLRKTIDKPFASSLLKTLPGSGLRLTADDE
jgi:DNA-binding response OmpR family regulator